jgi:hypothetical protein
MPNKDDPKPRSEGKNAKKGNKLPYSSKHVRIQEALLDTHRQKSHIKNSETSKKINYNKIRFIKIY